MTTEGLLYGGLGVAGSVIGFLSRLLWNMFLRLEKKNDQLIELASRVQELEDRKND